MSNLSLTRKNVYGLLSIVAILVIVLYAFAKTNNTWTSETAEYLFFNPFWAVVVVFVDKFFHEKLQGEYDIFKIKISKLKAVLNDGKDIHDSSYLLSIIEGVDDDMSTKTALRHVQERDKKVDSVKEEINSPIIE